MLFSRLLRFTALLMLSLLGSPAGAESSVWKVSNDAGYFYIGGTIHLLALEDYPLPEEFNVAYDDSNRIVLETDVSGVQGPLFQMMLLEAMAYTDSRTLSSVLKPDVYDALDTFLQSRQIPIASFSHIQPWGVMLMITMMEYQSLGLLPENGVDLHFNNRAVADKKGVSGLESPEEQLAFLISMGELEPNQAVESTLKDLQHLPEFVDLMKASWRSGDLDALSKYGLVEEMQREAPELYDSLIVSRNNAWLKQLPLLIGGHGNAFVLVGAMHLEGEQGVLRQLELQGFKVEQL